MGFFLPTTNLPQENPVALNPNPTPSTGSSAGKHLGDGETISFRPCGIWDDRPRGHWIPVLHHGRSYTAVP